jgi:LysR family transcriptional regulator of gallate degradation
MSFCISLRHLRVFVAVARLGSVTNGAEALFRAQSAVTRSIRELESTFGVELFERKSTGMLCTVFGNALLFRAERAMQEFELCANEIIGSDKIEQSVLKDRITLALFNARRLMTFVKLAELGHMPTVAKALDVSQPAVSSAIKELEASVGTVLFIRTSKGMIPTPRGEILLFRTKRALAELRHVQADIGALNGTTEGRVVVGALPLGRTAILPKAISNVLLQHPRLRFATVEGAFDKLANGLRAGDIDFIFGALRPPDYARDLAGEALMTDQMTVVVRNGHPLSLLPKIDIDDLLNTRWVLSGQETPSRVLFDQAFSSLDRRPPIDAVETSDLAILRGLLLNSDMATAISAQQLHYEIASGALKALEIDLPNTNRMIGITQRLESHASPGAIALMTAIRNVVAEGKNLTVDH